MNTPKLSEWHSIYDAPDLNGVYERRNLDAPSTSPMYCLYRNGWHTDCPTIELAAQSTTRAGIWGKPSPTGMRTIILGAKKDRIEWRGLAEKPKGMKPEISSKWNNRFYR